MGLLDNGTFAILLQNEFNDYTESMLQINEEIGRLIKQRDDFVEKVYRTKEVDNTF